MKTLEKFIGKVINGGTFIAPKLFSKILYNIFCYPFGPKLKPFQKEFLESSKTGSIKVNDEELVFYKWGSGSKKILLVHGWASHSFRWKNYVKNFDKSQFTLIALDAPAHGLSEGRIANIPKYVAALKAIILAEGQVDTIVSHSFGGLAIQTTLYENPELDVDKLMIMGAPTNAINFLNFYREKLGISNRATDIINAEVKKRFGVSLDHFTSERFAPELKQEILIVHDKEDKDVNYKEAEFLHSLSKNSKLILTEGLGHRLKSSQIIDLVFEFSKNGLNNINKEQEVFA